MAKELEMCGMDDAPEWWLVSTSVDLFIRNPVPPVGDHVSAPQRMTGRMKTHYNRSFTMVAKRHYKN